MAVHIVDKLRGAPHTLRRRKHHQRPYGKLRAQLAHRATAQHGQARYTVAGAGAVDIDAARKPKPRTHRRPAYTPEPRLVVGRRAYHEGIHHVQAAFYLTRRPGRNPVARQPCRKRQTQKKHAEYLVVVEPFGNIIIDKHRKKYAEHAHERHHHGVEHLFKTRAVERAAAVICTAKGIKPYHTCRYNYLPPLHHRVEVKRQERYLRQARQRKIAHNIEYEPPDLQHKEVGKYIFELLALNSRHGRSILNRPPAESRITVDAAGAGASSRRDSHT